MLFFYMKRDFTLIPLAKALATAFDKVLLTLPIYSIEPNSQTAGKESNHINATNIGPIKQNDVHLF